jgi:hypothetical protein
MLLFSDRIRSNGKPKYLVVDILSTLTSCCMPGQASSCRIFCEIAKDQLQQLAALQ